MPVALGTPCPGCTSQELAAALRSGGSAGRPLERDAATIRFQSQCPAERTEPGLDSHSRDCLRSPLQLPEVVSLPAWPSLRLKSFVALQKPNAIIQAT